MYLWPETLRNSYKVTEPLSQGGEYQDLNPSLAAFRVQGRLKGYPEPCQESLLNVVLVYQRKGITLPEHSEVGGILQIK